jgi:plastocyanin
MKTVRGGMLVVALAGATALGGGAAADGGTTPGARVDPRAGGFEIVLGEWAVTAEARAMRPGPVTIVVRNRGRFLHGLEIKREGGHGGGDRDEAESVELRPGESTRMTLDLAPGIYEIECFVGEHDDRGMRGILEVRADAPLVAPRARGAGRAVEIVSFAFTPPTLRTTVGSVVTWRNSDAAPHTATGKQFSSPQLRKGVSYRHRFTRAGTYTYLCALHPAMRGKVVVAAR